MSLVINNRFQDVLVRLRVPFLKKDLAGFVKNSNVQLLGPLLYMGVLPIHGKYAATAEPGWWCGGA